MFKVPAHYTSQECAKCGHTHPDNRKTQALFSCVNCGHIDNADRNASSVIKQRAINLFLDSGTELAGKGIPLLVKGRGAIRKSEKARASLVVGNETSKKKGTAVTLVTAWYWKLASLEASSSRHPFLCYIAISVEDKYQLSYGSQYQL